MSVIHGKCGSMLKLSSNLRIHKHKHNITQTCFMFPDLITQNRNNTCKASIKNDNISQPLNISVDINQSDPTPLISGSDVVRKFYDGINRHDIPSVEPLISVNCVYEDLIFSTPFVGRKVLLLFLFLFFFFFKNLQYCGLFLS